MATVRNVPFPYATIQAAHDGASDGDTILISPGTYGNVRITKRVNLKGNTDNPANVVIQYGNPQITIACGNLAQPLLIEGVTLKQTDTGGYPYANVFFASPNNGVGQVVFNRCIFRAPDQRPYYNSMFLNEYSFEDGNYSCAKVRMDNCTISNPSASYYDSNNNSRLILVYCISPRVPDNFGTALKSNVLTACNFSAQPAVGYGTAYGNWMDPNAIPAPYRLAGKLRLGAGGAPDDAKVHLYRKNAANTLETTPWAVATPGAPDAQGFAAWSFDYLPTDLQYYVAIVTPTGHESKLLGPYVPAQG